MKRQVWKTAGAGQISHLKLQTETLGDLKDDWVRVKTKAIGLNFADIFALAGLYSATPKGEFIPGLEFCGDIIEVGSGVSGFQLDDRVMGLTRFGGYADVIDINPDYCKRLPETWSYEQGAGFLAQTLTAWYAIHTLGAGRAGQTVLIHSAAGGVGLQALKISKAMGMQPIGTVSLNTKKEFLAQQGFDEIVIRTPDLIPKLKMQLNNRPLNLVLDAVGGHVQKQSYQLLSPMGRMVVYGAAEFTPGKNRPHYLKALLQYLNRPRYDVMTMISDNKSVMAFNLIWLWQFTDLFNALMKEIQGLAITPPYVGNIYPFDQALQALEKLRTGSSIGKVVLKV